MFYCYKIASVKSMRWKQHCGYRSQHQISYIGRQRDNNKVFSYILLSVTSNVAFSLFLKMLIYRCSPCKISDTCFIQTFFHSFLPSALYSIFLPWSLALWLSHYRCKFFVYHSFVFASLSSFFSKGFMVVYFNSLQLLGFSTVKFQMLRQKKSVSVLLVHIIGPLLVCKNIANRLFI